MGKHVFHKVEGVDQQRVSEKMATFMLQIAKTAHKNDPELDMKHVRENFSIEEMAYVVCVHAAGRVMAVLEANPDLNKMVDIIKAVEDVKEDGQSED